MGTWENWSYISKKQVIVNADMMLYIYSETKPTLGNEFWHMVNGERVIWDSECSKGLTFTLNSDANGYQVSKLGSCLDESLVIPAVYNGFPVTEIRLNAFNGAKLKSVVIPEGIKTIQFQAFRNCTELTYVKLPYSVESIEANAFVNCKIKTIDYDGSQLEWEAIEKNINWIDLNSAHTILYRIGESLQYRLSITGSHWLVASIGNITDTSIIIPSEYRGIPVKAIGDNAFNGCNNLTSITIPEGVTSIGDWAFTDCSNLASITIPEGVTNIGNGAFNGCSSLTSIALPEGVTNIGNDAFKGCSSLTSVTILKGVTSIGEYAFYGCSSLVNVSIPKSVTRIKAYAFKGCSSLANIDIPESVTSIGAGAFSGCSTLTTITIPKGVTSIGSYAFRGCSNLASITIPESVTSIGNASFSDCNNLKEFIFQGTKAQWENLSKNNWNATMRNYIVYCTDGTISK